MAAGIQIYYERRSYQLALIDASSDDSPMLKRESKHPAHLAYTTGFKSVTEYFSQYSNVDVIKSVVPSVLNELTDEGISFFYADLNDADAEHAALIILTQRLGQGFVVLFDGYGGYGRKKTRRGSKDFCSRKSTKFTCITNLSGNECVAKSSCTFQ